MAASMLSRNEPFIDSVVIRINLKNGKKQNTKGFKILHHKL
jgi:hypothetical protein